ncbi:hypothetical protein D3C87_1588780 [compost metagenome]
MKPSNQVNLQLLMQKLLLQMLHLNIMVALHKVLVTKIWIFNCSSHFLKGANCYGAITSAADSLMAPQIRMH